MAVTYFEKRSEAVILKQNVEKKYFSAKVSDPGRYDWPGTPIAAIAAHNQYVELQLWVSGTRTMRIVLPTTDLSQDYCQITLPIEISRHLCYN